MLQGWGNILNLAVLLFFLAVLGQRGPSYSPTALSVTWRMQYALGLLPIIYMLFHRIFYLKESAVWQVSTLYIQAYKVGLLAARRLVEHVLAASVTYCQGPGILRGGSFGAFTIKSGHEQNH